MPNFINSLRKICQPWTAETELPRLCFKIAQVVLNLICFGIAVTEYTTFSKQISPKPEADDSGQNWSRVAFIGITLANAVVSLGVLIMHCASRRNESYALVPSSEPWYYMISGALLIIVSIILFFRYIRSPNLGNSELMISAIVSGFIDAATYIVPAVQIWRGRFLLPRV